MSKDRNEFNVKEKTFDEVMDFLGEKWKDLTKSQKDQIVEVIALGSFKLKVELVELKNKSEKAIVFEVRKDPHKREDIIRHAILKLYDEYGICDGTYQVSITSCDAFLNENYIFVIDEGKIISFNQVGKDNIYLDIV